MIGWSDGFGAFDEAVPRVGVVAYLMKRQAYLMGSRVRESEGIKDSRFYN